MKHSLAVIEDSSIASPGHASPSGRVPHLSVAAFCLTPASRAAVEQASRDRRLTRVKTDVSDGGIAQVRKTFETKRTPSLLVVEVSTSGGALLAELDALAEMCDPETKVVIIGTANDIDLYRTLMARGISEYLIGPITPLAYVAMIQRLFAQKSTMKLGKVYVFVGAKGGVGSSTLAQNVAWTIAEEQESPTLLLDLDFRFGSAAMNLDLKPVQGLEKYLGNSDKLDAALLDRLILKRGEYFSVLPGYDDVLGDSEPEPETIERLIEIARASFPYVVVDLPHDWSAASRETLTSADEIILVTAPDLPNLRNAKALIEKLRALRPNDAPPRVILNNCGMPKRKEIRAESFFKSIGAKGGKTVAFDPATYGLAAAEGHTLREQAPRSKAQLSIRDLARSLTGLDRPAKTGWLRKLFGRG